MRIKLPLWAEAEIPAAGAPATPPADDKKKKEDNTAADTAAQGKSAREIALEKKISTLEDDHNSLKGQLKAATDWIAEQTKGKPATSAKADLLDEVNTFLGCGLS